MRCAFSNTTRHSVLATLAVSLAARYLSNGNKFWEHFKVTDFFSFCKALGELHCCTVSVGIALASLILIHACKILSQPQTRAPNICESLCCDWSMATFQASDFPHTSCTRYIRRSILSSPFIYSCYYVHSSCSLQ